MDAVEDPEPEQQEVDEAEAKQEFEREFDRIYEENYAIEDVYTSFNRLSKEDEDEDFDARFVDDTVNAKRNDQLTPNKSKIERNFANSSEKKKHSSLEDVLKASRIKENKPKIFISNEWTHNEDTL